MVIIPVAVEKVGFSEKSRKSGDRKCPGDWGKSFIELPDAIQFLQIPSERVFQQPPLFSTSIRHAIKNAVCFGLGMGVCRVQDVQSDRNARVGHHDWKL